MIDRSSLAKAWALLDGHERRAALLLLLLMVVGAFASALMVGSIFPFLSVLADPDLIERSPALSWAYRAGGFTSDYGFLVALGLAAITVIVLANLVLITVTWTTTRFAEMRAHSISRRLLAHYLAQPYDFFLNRHSGDMATNILAETGHVVGFFFAPVVSLIASVLTVAAVMGTLLLVDPVVAIATVGVFGAIYGGVVAFSRSRVRVLGRHRAEANQQRYRVAGEALGGIKDVKLLGREGTYLDRYAAPSAAMSDTVVRVIVLSQIPGNVIQMVAFGGLILLCLLLLDPAGIQEREALGGLLPLIGVLAFAGQRMMPEFHKIYAALTSMTAGAAALDQVYGDLTSGLTTRLPRHPPPPLGLNDNLVLEDVDYSYPNAARPGLDGINLEIRAGERIGIVGASGAGKTTLADIVLGLLTPQNGRLCADGRPVTEENVRAWRQTVGYVPQDIFLTDASLTENIAFGLPEREIDTAKVEVAAQIAQLHDFALSELPDGYATSIGERGVRLSGGQRQRIGIARALYHEADLIVFDEATSALDTLIEREVMTAIEALPGDKTVLIIAHRLTTVRSCDRIVVMDAGRVTAVGSWSELRRSNPLFRRMTDDLEVA